MPQEKQPDTQTDNDATVITAAPDATVSNQIVQEAATVEATDIEQTPQQPQQTDSENDTTATDNTTPTPQPQLQTPKPQPSAPQPASTTTTCTDPSHEDIATVSKAIQASLHGGLQRQNQRISRLSQELLQLQTQVRQLVKSAGTSHAEGMQAQQEQQQATKPQRHNMWEHITDGFGYLRKDVLQQRRSSNNDEA